MIKILVCFPVLAASTRRVSWGVLNAELRPWSEVRCCCQSVYMWFVSSDAFLDEAAGYDWCRDLCTAASHLQRCNARNILFCSHSTVLTCAGTAAVLFLQVCVYCDVAPVEVQSGMCCEERGILRVSYVNDAGRCACHIDYDAPIHCLTLITPWPQYADPLGQHCPWSTLKSVAEEYDGVYEHEIIHNV